MSEENEKPVTGNFELNDDVVTNLDLARVIRELEKLDDTLHQAKLREGQETKDMPKTTETLKNLTEANKISLIVAEDRKRLLEGLRSLKDGGKKIHISFAVEPSPEIVRKIAVWMRGNIQKNLILQIGIQPTISVGCVVRTTNKVFDMSLRSRFKNSKQLLPGLMEKNT